MPTFVYMTACDGCGHCVDICPSDIMHIDPVTRRAVNIEPNFCWECYSCVKACPQNAIDDRGYSDFAPMGHKVRVLREPEKGVISWRLNLEMVVRNILNHLLGLHRGVAYLDQLSMSYQMIPCVIVRNLPTNQII